MQAPLPNLQFKAWRFWRQWFGRRSECAAAKFLRKLGWRIVAANVHDGLGEIDLIALDGTTLVIVEVRSTSSDDPERAAETVNFAKQKRLTAAALRYLQRKRMLGMNYRFDVLAIAWPPEQKKPTILHRMNAFDATGQFQMFS